jgi:hypothetical protein
MRKGGHGLAIGMSMVSDGTSERKGPMQGVGNYNYINPNYGYDRRDKHQLNPVTNLIATAI